MKGFLVLFLAALCMKMAFSLQCYRCPTPTNSKICTSVKNCTDTQTWCYTAVYGPSQAGYPFQGGRLVVRDCAETCKASNPDYLGITRPTICCKEDLCNVIDSAQNVISHNWALTSFGSFVFILLQTRN
ncbi:ly6/PLAUR domain-containing protein 2-like [Discoglossus pictus]